MKFFDSEGDKSYKGVKEKYDRYMEYVSSNTHRFPKHAYEFAVAEWHYNPSDHRCPHDSWLESLQINEKPSLIRKDFRQIEARILLLGAYHDGQLEIVYHSVKSYDLKVLPDHKFPTKSHGDWLIDEVRVSDSNSVLHEISFWRDGIWQIECEDIECRWLPFENREPRAKH